MQQHSIGLNMCKLSVEGGYSDDVDIKKMEFPGLLLVSSLGQRNELVSCADTESNI